MLKENVYIKLKIEHLYNQIIIIFFTLVFNIGKMESTK